MPVNCYHINTYCIAYNSTKDDDLPPTLATPSVTVGPMLAPPSPLLWLPRCRRHWCRCHCRCRCHCHGCRRLHRHSFCCYCFRFLVDCFLPLRCLSASATVACPRRCHCWLLTPLPLMPRLQTTAPCSFRHDRCLLFLPLFLPLFSLMMFKILLRPSHILNIFVAVPCSFCRNRCLCFYHCPLLAPFPLPPFSDSDAMACPL
jgi:hypothetical protein